MPGWIGRLLGNRGERLAARFLRRQGYKILARQYSNRFGEIGLVALDGESLVFVEVKSRAALTFLRRHHLLERSASFDVVAILWPKRAKHPEIDHYRSAFTPVGFGQMYS